MYLSFRFGGVTLSTLKVPLISHCRFRPFDCNLIIVRIFGSGTNFTFQRSPNFPQSLLTKVNKTPINVWDLS